jgi:hypothetical protein
MIANFFRKNDDFQELALKQLDIQQTRERKILQIDHKKRPAIPNIITYNLNHVSYLTLL